MVLLATLLAGLAASIAGTSGAESRGPSCIPLPHSGDTSGYTDRSELHRMLNDGKVGCVAFAANTSYWIDGLRVNVPAGTRLVGRPGHRINLVQLNPYAWGCKYPPDVPCRADFLTSTNASGVVVDGLNIDGHRDQAGYDVPTRYPGGAAISFARPGPGLSKNVRIRGTTIRNWPGVSVFSGGFDDLTIKDSRSVNPGRGGFVITSQAAGGKVSENVSFINLYSTRSGDDALAMTGVRGFKVFGSTGTTRASGEDPPTDEYGERAVHGAGLALRNVAGLVAGERNVDYFRSRHSINAGVFIARYPEGGGGIPYRRLHPRNITVANSSIIGAEDFAVQVDVVRGGGGYSRNIRVRDNARLSGRNGATLWRDLDGGSSDVSPSSLDANTRMSSPKIQCRGVTGIAGADTAKPCR